MTTSHLARLLGQAIDASGSERVAEVLATLAGHRASTDIDTLTLVANAGVHVIPEVYLRGEVYEVSRGDWAVDTAADLEAELNAILTRLVRKLRSRPWQRVYLIPTGHPVLTVNVKLLVYRLLRLNTIDLYYHSGTYIDVQINHRRLSLSVDDRVSAPAPQ